MVADVVDKALAFEKRDRWPSAQAMLNAVREALSVLTLPGEVMTLTTSVQTGAPDRTSRPDTWSQRPVTHTPPALAHSRRRRRALIASGAVLAVAVVLLSVMMVGPSSHADRAAVEVGSAPVAASPKPVTPEAAETNVPAADEGPSGPVADEEIIDAEELLGGAGAAASEATDNMTQSKFERGAKRRRVWTPPAKPVGDPLSRRK